MSDFAREIVRCLNRFFKTRHIPGFACRPKQRTAISDVLADSPTPAYSLLIECKSIADRKLYFSQHFHADRDNVHPVEAIAEALAANGRAGYLAIEFRQGKGDEREAFLIPWAVVLEHYRTGNGITIDDARAGIALSRTKDGYVLEELRV
jgi:hypothetical protein